MVKYRSPRQAKEVATGVERCIYQTDDCPGTQAAAENHILCQRLRGDIARECKISRNTFYYHFKDKYDLISWIFYTEITSILSDDISLGHWRDSLLSLCKYMQENRDFYLNVLEFQGQNSFSECLMDFYQGLVAHLLFHADSQPALSQEQIRMVSRFYAHGITGVLLDWAHNGMTADPEPAVTMLEKLLSSDTVHQILSTQPKSHSASSF